MLKWALVSAAILFAVSEAHADESQAPASNANASSSGAEWSSMPDFGMFFSSLPFGWLNNVFSGCSMLGTGYSRLLMLGHSNVGVMAGGDFVMLEFSTYEQHLGGKYYDGGLELSYLVRLNVSVASGYRRLYGYGGVSLCSPIAAVSFLSNAKAATGIDGMYWQSHFGIGCHLIRWFDIGLRTSIALTKFDAGDGRGLDNNIALVGAMRF
jgi:hypothetical protein